MIIIILERSLKDNNRSSDRLLFNIVEIIYFFKWIYYRNFCIILS